MTIVAKTIEYTAGDTLCKGEYFTPQSSEGSLPVVLVCHAWDGLVDEVRDKSKKLAAEGYIAFAIDVHGGGKTYSDMADLEAALTPFMTDRQMLLDRLLGAVSAVKNIPGADTSRMAAIGYCFGGTCVLDLARATVNGLMAVVSFHGGLATNGLSADKAISAEVLVLHGQDDPLVPPPQVNAFIEEMQQRQANWELVSYGNTLHAFTRPDANNPDFGAVYSAKADRRSWRAMLQFLEEVL